MDPYTITASPSFGLIGGISNFRHFSFSSQKSNLDLDGKLPLLPENRNSYSKEFLDSISGAQSTWSQKHSFAKQLTGEFPIAYGCSVTQTVFNGKLCCYHALFPLFLICLSSFSFFMSMLENS